MRNLCDEAGVRDEDPPMGRVFNTKLAQWISLSKTTKGDPLFVAAP